MNNVFLYSVAAVMAFVVLLALGIWAGNYGAALSDKRESEVRETTQTIERYRTESEMLDMQMGDVCRDHAQHSSCRWYLEVYKERG